MTVSALSSQFSYVQEWEDEFLALFPHRFDYIYAPYPDAETAPEWRTESRHPLSDRILRQGSFLFGVRFGARTRYCMLDIDKGSQYHPRADPLAVSRILAALEPIGLVSYVACTSSYSGGLHLYFPFQQSQSSWELASGVATLLENSGFVVRSGQLEVFPNPKPYSVEGKPTLFNAHRLPLQVGSYLLNQDFQPVSGYQHAFLRQWQFAQDRNTIEPDVLKRVLKQAKRRHFCISGKADKFINDLNAEIELGWTGFGQTNRLLGRITMRTYIFHHVVVGGTPLTGEALVEEIVRVARSLPGYTEWCRHRHEIEQRATEWARCIETSHYFHYGDRTGKYQLKNELSELKPALTGLPTWNQQQSASARERIRLAIADLLEKDQLPVKPTARFRLLTEYGIGGGSLYRHRDLWHPNYMAEAGTEAQITEMATNASQSVENPPYPPSFIETAPSDQADLPSNGRSSTSLFPSVDGDDALGKDSSRSTSTHMLSTGRNSDSWYCDRFQLDQNEVKQLPLFDRSIWSEVSQEAVRIAQTETKRLQQEAQQRSYIARMQQFLASGDPILVAEAWAWAAVNPGVLDTSRLKLPDSQLPSTSPSISPSNLPSNLPESPLSTSPLPTFSVGIQQQDEPLNSKRTLLSHGASLFDSSDLSDPDLPDPDLPDLSDLSDPAGSLSDGGDFSDLLAAISIELRRLGWTATEIRQELQQQFGKGSRSLLSGAELQQWLVRLAMFPGAEP